MKIELYDTIKSTNETAIAQDEGVDFVVAANEQTGGKGTKGRQFLSARGGVYLTMVKHPHLATERAFQIMVNACVAVCKTVEEFGLTPRIRWANDVLIGNKKVSGTLIENTFSGPVVVRSVVGIGLNVNNPIAPEIAAIATSMQQQLNTSLSVEEVRNTLIDRLEREYSVREYKQYIDWFGQPVTIVTADNTIQATALDVGEDGRLVVEVQGKQVKISSGEVSLRLV